MTTPHAILRDWADELQAIAQRRPADDHDTTHQVWIAQMMRNLATKLEVENVRSR